MLRWLVLPLLFLALVAGGGVAAYRWFMGQGATSKLAGAQEQAGEATVGQGQARAQRDALEIYHAGQDRERVISNKTEAIRAKVLSAQGADSPLDPAVVAAVNDGLRQLSASDDHP